MTGTCSLRCEGKEYAVQRDIIDIVLYRATGEARLIG